MNKFVLIQSFIKVVEEGSFTAAAEKLGKTKALISTQITQLESHLQVKLFKRNTRQISLTENGQDYYRGCKTLLEQWDALEGGLCQNQDTISGSLQITAPLNFGEKTLSPLLIDFLSQYPDLSIALDLCDRQVDLIQEDFDFAFRIGILEDSRLIALPLQSFDMVVCASKHYLKNHPSIKTPYDLKAHRCIVDTQHKLQNKWPFQLDNKAITLRVNPVLSVNHAYSAALAAANGLGVTRVPMFAAEDFIKEGKLMPILTNYSIESHSLYLMYVDRQYKSRKAKVFKEFIMQHFISRQDATVLY